MSHVQACPVCLGRGWMPYGFFTGNTVGTSTANETCRPCGGFGIVTVAAESSQAARCLSDFPSLGDQDTPRNREHADRVDRAAFPGLPESQRYIPRCE